MKSFDGFEQFYEENKKVSIVESAEDFARYFANNADAIPAFTTKIEQRDLLIREDAEKRRKMDIASLVGLIRNIQAFQDVDFDNDSILAKMAWAHDEFIRAEGIWEGLERAEKIVENFYTSKEYKVIADGVAKEIRQEKEALR